MKLKSWVLENKSVFSERDLRFLVKNIGINNFANIYIDDITLNEETNSYLERAKRMYSSGMPLAYILGNEDFFGWNFKVDKRVLIPRKETEIITEKAIEIIRKNNLYYILDLCCGCCNIAISIKKSIEKDLFICASDISLKAIEVARINLENHKTEINLINSDLLKSFKEKSFDLITSNPPYVEKDQIGESLKYEPRRALAAEEGIEFLEIILQRAHLYLRDKGYLILEMGYKHKNVLLRIIGKIGCYDVLEWIKDYSGHDRGVVIRKG